MYTEGHSAQPSNGFSLVELSIVLVILGLLVGGILAGQSLIRAAEIRSVTTESQKFMTGFNAFRDRYMGYPGDLTNATAFWGDDNAACPDAAVANGTPGTCNGNGNAFMDAGAAGATSELFQLWKQMALAGLIEGNYSGLAGAGGSFHYVMGTNGPRSKVTNAGWGIASRMPNFGGGPNDYKLDYGNFLAIGTQTASSMPTAAAFRPEEAWNIDTKMDDGRPGLGKVIVTNWNDACATGGATNADLATSVYKLSENSVQCAIYFLKVF